MSNINVMAPRFRPPQHQTQTRQFQILPLVLFQCSWNDSTTLQVDIYEAKLKRSWNKHHSVDSPKWCIYLLTNATATPINTAVVEMLMHIIVSTWLSSWRVSSANTKIGFNCCLLSFHCIVCLFILSSY